MDFAMAQGWLFWHLVRVVEVEISSGVNRGNHILIPHITIAPSNTELPFTLKHCQFPLHPSFAMSTNKGQTLQFVDIYLSDHLFTHGQLYFAFSRVQNPSALAVCLNNPDEFTRNIVFQEVLWLYMYTLSRTMRSLCPQTFNVKHGSATSLHKILRSYSGI